MKDSSNIVTLIAGGRRHEGWTSVRATAGIECTARDFSVNVTYRWPGQAARQRVCNPLDSCVLMIGSDRVLTGYIDATPIRYDEADIAIGLSGRSKTCDLVDCSAAAAPGQWLGQKVEAIATDLAKPYGITVRAETDTGAAIADHQVQQGETAFESIDRLLRQRQLLATDDGEGALVFIKPGALRATTSLVLGKNIKQANYPCNWQDRYSTYVCKGQGSGNDASFGTDVAAAKGTATDSAVKRNRVLLIQQSGQADTFSCADRATHERDLRAAKSELVNYTVQGWRQADGTLWKPNMLVRVTDNILEINRDMLITEVTYSIDSSGTLAALTVMPPEAFKIIGD